MTISAVFIIDSGFSVVLDTTFGFNPSFCRYLTIGPPAVCPLPIATIVFDFNQSVKSLSKGLVSLSMCTTACATGTSYGESGRNPSMSFSGFIALTIIFLSICAGNGLWIITPWTNGSELSLLIVCSNSCVWISSLYLYRENFTPI